MKERIATTVKLDPQLYGDFKSIGIQQKLTLQTFVEKCTNLYTKDISFRSIVDSYILFPKLSTSVTSGLSFTGSLSGSFNC